MLFEHPAVHGQTTVATSLSSFSGIEDPQVIYDPTNNVFSSNPYTNIVDEGNPGNGEMFRFTLRYYPTPQTAWPGYPSTFWDGNLNTTSGSSATDRQRAEVKGLGQFQQINTTFQYSFSFETDPNFVGTSSFCHIFQLKGLDSSGGDPGDDPVVTLSLGSNDKGSLELYSPDGQGMHITIARTFSYAPNTWESAVIRISTSATNGSVMASINGDAMQGVSGVPVDITGLNTYRPKWGFYRGINSNLFDGINYIQDQNITAQVISGAALTWNNTGGASPSNGTTWDTTNNNWNNGTGATMYTDSSPVTFNDTNNSHYAVTLNTTVNPSSVTFSNSSGSYVLSGSGQIAGTTSLVMNGTNTVTIGTANTYTGGTTIDSGTVVTNSTTALGSATNALVLGTPVASSGGTTTPTGALTMNASITVGTFSCTTDNATANVLTINSGKTLTDNGSFVVGPVNTDTTGITYTSALTATGGGAISVSGSGNFLVGQPSNNSGGKDSTTADFSGLNSVTVNTTGTLGVGLGANSKGLMLLAQTTAASIAPSNSIAAGEMDVGNTQGNNDPGSSTLLLGTGANTLQAGVINVGIGKTGGAIAYPSGGSFPNASVAITATNITVGQATGGTYGSGRLAQILLAGHPANVQTTSLMIGDNSGNSGGGANATISFDTGTFNAQSVIVAADTGGSSTVGPTGTLVIGGASPSATATGVLSVGSSGSPGTFDLGDMTNNVAAIANASFVINGGVANVFANIVSIDSSVLGSVNSTLKLAGNGVLNMEGNSIGSAALPITSVQLAPNASDNTTIQNLGGGGVNGAGLSMSGAGTVTLLGTNTYSGGTAVHSGTVIVGANGAMPDSNVSITGGTLRLGTSTGLAQVTSLSISGAGVLDVNNNHVIVTYTSSDPISTIAGYLQSGFNNGTWTGAGINSTAAAANPGYALGYADAADPGNPAGLASGTIEIKFTLVGDVDLNGVVNGIDFGILAANFNQSVSRWDQGDFDYNGIVNGVDFTNLASNFNKAASNASDIAALDAFAAANGLLADVPEPGCMMVGVVIAGALLRRRSRGNPRSGLEA
jgi:autotransporter-associated beta strand protein